VSIRRWLPWVVALGVVAVTTVVVLAIPNRHVCPAGYTPIQAASVGVHRIQEPPFHWMCASDDSPNIVPVVGTAHRIPLRIGIAFGGLALALGLGVAVHKAYPPVPRSTAPSDADTIRQGPAEGGAT
jgi:hypothetical protein